MDKITILLVIGALLAIIGLGVGVYFYIKKSKSQSTPSSSSSAGTPSGTSSGTVKPVPVTPSSYTVNATSMTASENPNVASNIYFQMPTPSPLPKSGDTISWNPLPSKVTTKVHQLDSLLNAFANTSFKIALVQNATTHGVIQVWIAFSQTINPQTFATFQHYFGGGGQLNSADFTSKFNLPITIVPA
jgi:hypothetical protein